MQVISSIDWLYSAQKLSADKELIANWTACLHALLQLVHGWLHSVTSIVLSYNTYYMDTIIIIYEAFHELVSMYVRTLPAISL